jgi:hypothetical protein
MAVLHQTLPLVIAVQAKLFGEAAVCWTFWWKSIGTVEHSRPPGVFRRRGGSLPSRPAHTPRLRHRSCR